MKAIVLCAGRGKRMRELTAHNSKPLIKLWGRSMIDWQLDRLKKGGIREVVVNTAHYADLYPPHFAAHPVEGIKVTISQEGTSISDALETKGGIVKALPLLSDGEEPFVVVSGDIVTAFDYASLEKAADRIRKGEIVGHLVLVPNPSFHDGDMDLKTVLSIEPIRSTPTGILRSSRRKSSQEKSRSFPSSSLGCTNLSISN